MLIVNTSVAGAFDQLHHSPFLTKYITFADVRRNYEVAYSRLFSRRFFSAQDFQHQYQNHL